MTPAFETRSLRVLFRDHVSLDGINISVPQNSFFTVIGPNGAGKSIFLKSLIGVELGSHSQTQGEVLFFGQKPLQRNYSDLGYVPQKKTFDSSFPATSIELVASGLLGHWPFRLNDEHSQVCHQSLEQFGVKHLAQRTLSNLSGGELQRVYLARAMIRKPKALFLDEPSTGMDIEGEGDLYDRLEKIRQETNTTILMITHDQTVATHHSTHVLLLNQKQIAFGKPNEALTEENLRKAFGHTTHSHGMPTG